MSTNMIIGNKYIYYSESNTRYSFKKARLELLEIYRDSEAPSFAYPPPWVTYYKFEITSALVNAINAYVDGGTLVLTKTEVNNYVFSDKEDFEIISSLQDLYL